MNAIKWYSRRYSWYIYYDIYTILSNEGVANALNNFRVHIIQKKRAVNLIIEDTGGGRYRIILCYIVLYIPIRVRFENNGDGGACTYIGRIRYIISVSGYSESAVCAFEPSRAIIAINVY